MATHSAPSQQPTIIVVEDEELVSLFLKESLQEAGFEVRTFSEADQLLQIFDELALDAAIIDVGLPGMRGDALAKECRTRRRDLPIILSTGYDEHRYVEAVQNDPHLRVIGKPYDMPRLFNLLEEMGLKTSQNFVSQY